MHGALWVDIVSLRIDKDDKAGSELLNLQYAPYKTNKPVPPANDMEPDRV